jgi:hypothetical protein
MTIICSTPRATIEKRSQIQPIAAFLYFKNEWGNRIDRKQRPFFQKPKAESIGLKLQLEQKQC